MVEARRLARKRAEEHRRGCKAIEALEQRRNARQRDDQLRHVAGPMERRDGVAEQHQCRLGLAVGGVQARASRRKEAFEEVDAMLTHVGDALVPGRERAAHVRLGERHPCDPERVGDPIGVAERSRGGDGFFGERERLLDPAARLEAVDIGGEAVTAVASIPLRHRTGELDIVIEVAAVHRAQRLDERGVSGLARVIAGIDFQLGRSVRVRASSLRPSCEARVTSRGVQAGKTADVGRGCGREQILGPGQRFEQLHGETHQRGMRRDVGRDLQLAASSCSTGIRNAGCPAPSPPSRPHRATRARSSAPIE